MTRLLPLACLVALAGCRPADDIRTYTVPKSKAAPPEATPAEQAGATDRLLGALIPSPDGRWFSVKLSGPIAGVSAQADAFREFVGTVRLNPGAGKPLTYTVPAGWADGPGTDMRLATLKTPGGLEVKVFVPFGGSLLDNVLRWRKEVGAPPVTESDLPVAAPELKAGDLTIRLVDVRGSGGSGGMAPFAPRK